MLGWRVWKNEERKSRSNKRNAPKIKSGGLEEDGKSTKGDVGIGGKAKKKAWEEFVKSIIHWSNVRELWWKVYLNKGMDTSTQNTITDLEMITKQEEKFVQIREAEKEKKRERNEYERQFRTWQLDIVLKNMKNKATPGRTE